MNEYQIKAMVYSANFLYENSMSRNFLYEILEESFKAKEHLNDLLGLEEKNEYKVEIPIEEGDGDDRISQFVRKFCEIKSLEDGSPWTMVDKMFVQDSKKNKYKITRLFNKPNIMLKLWRTDIGRDIIESSGKIICCSDCSFSNSAKFPEFSRLFSIWYGEQTKTNCRIILSSHPLDILTASSNASFTSCYSPQGGFFNGTITSMLSKDTLVASVEEDKRPGYKIGRSWIYVNNDMIICARKYGSITDRHHLYIRNYIYSKIGGNWIHKPSLRISPEIVKLIGPGYLDNNYGDVMVNKEVNLSNLTPIVLPLAICLYCGRRYNDHPSLGVCKTCAETVPRQEYLE